MGAASLSIVPGDGSGHDAPGDVAQFMATDAIGGDSRRRLLVALAPTRHGDDHVEAGMSHRSDHAPRQLGKCICVSAMLRR